MAAITTGSSTRGRLAAAVLATAMLPAAAFGFPLDSIFLGTGGDVARAGSTGPRLQAAVRWALPADGRAAVLFGGAGTSRWDLETSVQTGGSAGRPFGLCSDLGMDFVSRPRNAGERATAARLSPSLRRAIGALEVNGGVTWAGGTTGAGWSSATGLVWGLSGERGALSFSWEGRTGSATRTSTEIGGPKFPGDSTYLVDPYTITHRSRRAYGDTQLRLGYTQRRWQAAADLGVRVGRDPFGPRSFGGAEAAWSVRPGVALFASSRFEPSIPEQRLPARRTARAGLALTRLPFGLESAHPGGPVVREARPFELTRLGDGRIEVRCRIPSARRVIATGDFTDWQPREMEPAGGGWWRLRAAAPTGPHQISISVDGGGWAAPRGIPAGDDGFGGEVGLFFVP